MELDTVSQPAVEQIERLGGADLVIGILESEHAEEADAAVKMVREAVSRLVQGAARGGGLAIMALIAPPLTDTEAAGGDQVSGRVPVQPARSRTPRRHPRQSRSREYRNVFALGRKLEARACGVIASQSQAATPQWIRRLVQPVLDLGFDLVAPRYTRHKMEGLLNRSVLSPLHRALYGEQLQNPMGPDFGLSGKLLQRLVGDDSATAAPTGTICWHRLHPPPRAADFRFANRIWAPAPSRQPTG